MSSFSLSVTKHPVGAFSMIGDCTNQDRLLNLAESKPVETAVSEVRLAFERAIWALKSGQTVTMTVQFVYNPPK